MEERVTDLEVRLTHQDAAVDELTKVVLKQEKQIDKLMAEVEQLKGVLTDMSSSVGGGDLDDKPPPHY